MDGWTIDVIDDSVVFSYSCSPKDNTKIIFEVKQIYTNANIFPFFPAVKHKAITDNFIDAIKEYVLASQEDSLSLVEKLNFDALAISIYRIMTEVNTVMEHYGLELTKYSARLSIPIKTQQGTTVVDFAEYDIDKIRETLRLTIQT